MTDRATKGVRKMRTLSYMQVKTMDYDEKLKMYKRYSKKKLAKMLIEANRLLEMFRPMIWAASEKRRSNSNDHP